MNAKLFGLVASLALLGTASQTTANPVSPTDYFSEASTTGPFSGTTDTGQLGTTTAQSTNPVTDIYWNSTAGFNPSAGTFISAGGATALADRGTGQLHAAAGATVLTTGATIGFPATATATFGDTLFFTAPGASATTYTTIGFTAHVDGILGLAPGQSGVGSGQPYGLFSLSVGNSAGLGGFHPTTFGVSQSYSDFISWYGLPNTVSHDMIGSFTFEGPAASVALLMQLFAEGQYGYADFSNTAAFTFDTLPTGVSFTSASGDFLTATPLPAALPLFATGLGALGLLGWRRKRKNAALAAA